MVSFRSIALIAAAILSLSTGSDGFKNESDECTFELLNEEIRHIALEIGTVVILCFNDTAQHIVASNIIVQAHVHRGTVTLSLDRELQDGRYANGSNVGVVSSVKDGDLARWFLVSHVSHGDDNHVSIMAKAYTEADPVPGGCNLELPLKNDPNVYLKGLDSRLSAVEFAYGDSGSGSKCGSLMSKASVQYDVYQFFMDERDQSATYYHHALDYALNSSYVKRNALLVTSLSSDDLTRLMFPAYRGIGTIFVVIMTVTHGNVMREASYVPAVTYFCDDLGDVCNGEDELPIKILVSVLAVIGLFVCFCGHRFFKLEMFFFGVLAAMLVAYILLERFSFWTFSTYLYISIGVAVVGGLIWWLVWMVLGIPHLSVSLVALLLGYVLVSIIFNASPVGNFWWLHFNVYFHSVFFSSILLPFAVSLFAPRQVNVLSCAVVGSFFVVFAADICLYGAFKYVLLNTIWKSSTPSFVEAFCFLPFQLSDILLYVVWAIIAISGTVVHYFLERNRPPFPKAPWKDLQCSSNEALSRNESENYEHGNEDDEHQPLLFNTRRRSSQSATRTWREQPVEHLGQPAENSREWWQLPQDSASSSAAPVVSNVNTPPPPYEEPEPLWHAV